MSLDSNTSMDRILGDIVPVDNLPRDYEKEAQTINNEKLSVQIAAVIGSNKFPPLLKHPGHAYTGNRVVHPCKPIKLLDEDTQYRRTYKLVEFVSSADHKAVNEPYRPYRICPPQSCSQWPIMDHRMDKLAEGEFYNRSLFDCFCYISTRNTPEKLAPFFEAGYEPYGPYKIPSVRIQFDVFSHLEQSMPFAKYRPTGELLQKEPNWSEAKVLETVTSDFVTNFGKRYELIQGMTKCFNTWLQFVIPVHNMHGGVVQVFLKLIDYSRGTKQLVPCSSFSVSGQPHNLFFCTPQPRQLLTGMDSLMLIDDETPVILTDSVAHGVR